MVKINVAKLCKVAGIGSGGCLKGFIYGFYYHFVSHHIDHIANLLLKHLAKHRSIIDSVLNYLEGKTCKEVCFFISKLSLYNVAVVYVLNKGGHKCGKISDTTDGNRAYRVLSRGDDTNYLKLKSRIKGGVYFLLGALDDGACCFTCYRILCFGKLVEVGVKKRLEAVAADLVKGVGGGGNLSCVFLTLKLSLLGSLDIVLNLLEVSYTEGIKNVVGYLIVFINYDYYFVGLLRVLTVDKVVLRRDIFAIAHKLSPGAAAHHH